MVELSYQMVLSTIQTVGLLIGIFYYIITLRNQQKTQELSRQNQELTLETRQAQLFMNIFNNFSSKGYQKDLENILAWEYDNYEDFFAKYGADVNPEDHSIFDHNLQWMEGLGVLVRRGLIDANLVFEIMYGTIINFYEKFEPILAEFRVQWGPFIQQDLTYLYNEMKRIQGEKGYDFGFSDYEAGAHEMKKY